MELLDKYLATIGNLLPRKTGADILREIADEIESQIEEKADALGRPLTEKEQAAVIRRHGHPVVVAARYGRQRSLIGPGIFPVYWQTLKTSIGIALAIWTVVIAAALMSSDNPGREWVPLVLRVPGVLVTIFGTITALFAAGEFLGKGACASVQPRWDPRSLPDHRPSRERAQLFVRFLLGVAGAVWWQLVPSNPFLALGPAADFLSLGPAWQELHWPVLILIAANTVRPALQIWGTERAAWQPAISIVLDAAEIGVLLLAMRSGGWIAVQPGLPGAASYSLAAAALNRILSVGCAAGLFIRTVQFVFKHFHYRREAWPKRGSRTFRPFDGRRAG